MFLSIPIFELVAQIIELSMFKATGFSFKRPVQFRTSEQLYS